MGFTVCFATSVGFIRKPSETIGNHPETTLRRLRKPPRNPLMAKAHGAKLFFLHMRVPPRLHAKNIVLPGHPHGQRLKCFSFFITVCGSLWGQAAVVGLSFLHRFRGRSTLSLLAARLAMRDVFLPWRQCCWKPNYSLCWTGLPSGPSCLVVHQRHDPRKGPWRSRLNLKLQPALKTVVIVSPSPARDKEWASVAS